MTDVTKVTFSDGELSAITNVDFILTKRSAIEKVSTLFSNQFSWISFLFKEVFVHYPHVLQVAPKISKGENYMQLPYVIMDYPAIFGKNDICAVRTMFLWGEFISITLHLAGSYKKDFENSLLKNCNGVNDIFCCVGEDQWAHHFMPDNYKIYENLTALDIENIQKRNFLKIAFRYHLDQLENMDVLLKDGYKKMAELLVD